MIPLYTQDELKKAKYKDKLLLKCEYCGYNFFTTKRYIIIECLNPNKTGTGDFCSISCSRLNQLRKMGQGSKTVECLNCEKQFLKKAAEIKKRPNNFCSRSCAATYNNTHKTNGCRRSKLEKYLEKELLILYPNLEFHFCRKDAINSELDIYIPELKLAFELNGIFHYEPIYGQDKLNQIQNNDKRKFQACLEAEIELCIIDSSSLSYFKENKATKYLKIIRDLINKKLVVDGGSAPLLVGYRPTR